MTTQALVFMCITQISIFGITAYFFYRVLKKRNV